MRREQPCRHERNCHSKKPRPAQRLAQQCIDPRKAVRDRPWRNAQPPRRGPQVLAALEIGRERFEECLRVPARAQDGAEFARNGRGEQGLVGQEGALQEHLVGINETSASDARSDGHGVDGRPVRLFQA
jgi:hypothetical protein